VEVAFAQSRDVQNILLKGTGVFGKDPIHWPTLIGAKYGAKPNKVFNNLKA
jgi:hypothetical protein